MYQNRDSRKYSNDAGPAAMQDSDRFPESVGWRLMSQLWGSNRLNHHVHNTRGHEGSIVLVVSMARIRCARARPRLGRNRNLQTAVASRTEDFVGFDDLIELETVREQRQR